MMIMHVDEAGRDHAAIEIDQPGVVAPKLLNGPVGSDCNDLAVLDRNGPSSCVWRRPGRSFRNEG